MSRVRSGANSCPRAAAKVSSRSSMAAARDSLKARPRMSERLVCTFRDSSTRPREAYSRSTFSQPASRLRTKEGSRHLASRCRLLTLFTSQDWVKPSSWPMKRPNPVMLRNM